MGFNANYGNHDAKIMRGKARGGCGGCSGKYFWLFLWVIGVAGSWHNVDEE